MNGVKKLACCVVLSAIALCAKSALAGSASLYVQDGLIACWDGIENAEPGRHDGTATVWKDIVHGYEFNLTNVTVEADRMTFAGSADSYGTLNAADTTSTFVAARKGTMEIVYASRTPRSSAPTSQVLLQSTTGSGLAFGYLSGVYIVPTTGSSANSLFQFPIDTNTNSVSIRYSAGNPVSPIYANSRSLSVYSGGRDAFGKPDDSTTFIGVRASKADNTHFPGSIYCIRLYNRHLTADEIAANHALDVKRFLGGGNLANDMLEVTASPAGADRGSPSPAYGSTTGLAAGQEMPVSCGATPWTNATMSVWYSCAGWKLYDENGSVVSNGTDTSFTYTHPAPAEYRKLEWQWDKHFIRKSSAASLYVQDGLVACWDGIENAGAGQHDDAATVWRDIVHGYEFNLTGVTVDADRMTFAESADSCGVLSSNDTASTFGVAKSGTMEIVYASRSSEMPQVLLQSTSDSGLALGFLRGHIFPATGPSAAPIFPYTMNKQLNSVSVRYSAGKPVSPIYTNGWSLAALNNKDTLGNSDNQTTFIGASASKLNLFPGSICCIRLYDRQLTDEEITMNYALDVRRFIEGRTIANDMLEVTASPAGADCASPSPAYGVTTGLAAGDTFVVSCGATPVLNDAETVRYDCTGWKLYDMFGNVVSNGTGTSFTYIHPAPAAYRNLEWQWNKHVVKKQSTASLYVRDGLVACWDGIENAGRGRHDDMPSTWVDIIGALGIAIPEWVTVESNGFYSVSSTDTRTYPAISSIPGLDDNVTIEVVAERVLWRKMDNYLALQPVISSPYGCLGFRFQGTYGVYYLLPISSAGTVDLYDVTSNSSGIDVSECHTYSARVTLPYDAANAMFVDGAAACGFVKDPYTTSTPSNWQFFNATRADIRIHAIRVYNRRLTDEEISANHALDVKRFQEGNNVKVPLAGFTLIVR